MKPACLPIIALISVLFSLLVHEPGHAADGATQIVVSAGAGLAPDYEGSRHYQAFPLLFIRAGLPDGRFLAFRGTGLTANIIKSAKWQAGPVINYRFARSSAENERVDRLRKVDQAMEMGAFVSLSAGPWGGKLTAVHDVAGGYDGALVEVEGSYRLAIGPKAMLALGLSATYADRDYMDTYFSVDADNAQRSGLSPFRADGGIKDVGAGLLYSRALQGNWGINGILKYSRLLGDAADSPLVAEEGSADQVFGGLFTSYRF